MSDCDKTLRNIAKLISHAAHNFCRLPDKISKLAKKILDSRQCGICSRRSSWLSLAPFGMGENLVIVHTITVYTFGAYYRPKVIRPFAKHGCATFEKHAHVCHWVSEWKESHALFSMLQSAMPPWRQKVLCNNRSDHYKSGSNLCRFLIRREHLRWHAHEIRIMCQKHANFELVHRIIMVRKMKISNGGRLTYFHNLRGQWRAKGSPWAYPWQIHRAHHYFLINNRLEFP